MSVRLIQSKISSVQGEIQSLQRSFTNRTKDDASKTTRIAQIKRSITSSTSISSLESKRREIGRLESDLARIQKNKADLTKRITDKTARLHKYQGALYKEQERDRTNFRISSNEGIRGKTKTGRIARTFTPRGTQI